MRIFNMKCPVCGDEIPEYGYKYIPAVKGNKPSRLYFCSEECKTGYRSGTAPVRPPTAAEVGT